MLLGIQYTEKMAIKGCPVDRFNYAMQLLQDNSSTSLIKAYAWLSLANEDVSLQNECKRLIHKIRYDLKSKGIFNEAQMLEESYQSKYSSQAFIASLKASKNPLARLLLFFAQVVQVIASSIEFLDVKIFKEKGSAMFWGMAAGCCSAMGFYILFHLDKINTFQIIFIIMILLLCVIFGTIFEKRLDPKQ